MGLLSRVERTRRHPSASGTGCVSFVLHRFSHVPLLANPWTVARQVALSMGILQAILELACPPPGDLPDPGVEPVSLTSPALAGGFFTSSAT